MALLGLAVVLAVTTAPAIAQDADTRDGADEQAGEPLELSISTARIDSHPTVQVTVDVPSLGGDAAIGPEAFTVTEDGETREVEVERLASQELDVMLVIDSSGSMAGEPLAAARAAVQEFVARMPPAVDIAVTRFGTEVELVSDFTTDRETTMAALDGLGSDSWTSMYDGIHAVLDVFDERDATRKAIVLLSDGADNRSVTTLEETVDRLSGRNETFTIVDLGTAATDTDEVDLAALNAMADAAGQGSVVSADDPDALPGVYEDIAATLLNQYELSFVSQAHVSAELSIRFEHAGIVAEGARTVELPAAPAEPEASEEPEDIEAPDREESVAEQPSDPFDSESASPPSPPTAPLAGGWWTEPWATNAAIAVFVVGLIGGLIYTYGWRVRDRFRSHS